MSSEINTTKHAEIAIDDQSVLHAAGVKENHVGGRRIQSVDRALMILEEVATENDGVALSGLAARTGLNPSTCHHLVSTLVDRGYLTHLSRRRGYSLGPRLRELLEMSERETEPSVLLRDDLKALGRRLECGVQLAVLSETSLLTKLSFSFEKADIPETDELQKMTSLHATATGKAILAWIPDTELVRIISANGMEQYTPNTITSLSGLIEELRMVRRRKYSIDDEELRPGVVCIGAAVREGGGAVVASISATLPANRATKEHRSELIKEVIMASNEFSKKLQSAKR